MAQIQFRLSGTNLELLEEAKNDTESINEAAKRILSFYLQKEAKEAIMLKLENSLESLIKEERVYKYFAQGEAYLDVEEVEIFLWFNTGSIPRCYHEGSSFLVFKIPGGNEVKGTLGFISGKIEEMSDLVLNHENYTKEELLNIQQEWTDELREQVPLLVDIEDYYEMHFTEVIRSKFFPRKEEMGEIDRKSYSFKSPEQARRIIEEICKTMPEWYGEESDCDPWRVRQEEMVPFFESRLPEALLELEEEE